MENREHKFNKGGDISESSTPTSSEVKNLKFINLSVLGDPDHPIFAETRGASLLKTPIINEMDRKQIENNKQTPSSGLINLQNLMNNSEPKKVPPNEVWKMAKKKNEILQNEMSLQEIGFNPNAIEGWENIKQPHKENLYYLLKQMIDLHIKPNIQIIIGQASFRCHMMVLQCYSGFFMECSNEIIIQLPEERITPRAFMMAYDWMLASEPLVQREGLLELFNAANFLKIKGLVDQCWVCLDDDERFQEDTAFLLYLEARVHGLEMLQQLMISRVCKFFLTLVSSSDFLSLSAKEVCTLLNSNSIGVNSEMEILMSAVRWLCHDWDARKTDMIQVMKCVRFGLIPPWILVALGRDNDGLGPVAQDPVVKKMIEDGLSFTTTQMFYADKIDDFLAFLERYKISPPIPRQWIYDKDCSYHHNPSCPNKQYITFESFLIYLDMIRTKGKDHWRKTLMLEENQGPCKFQCCELASPVPKTDRNSENLSELLETNRVTLLESTESKGSESVYKSGETTTDKCSNVGTETGLQPQINLQTIDRPNDSMSVDQSNTLNSPKSLAINIKQSVLSKTYYCSFNSKELEISLPKSSTNSIEVQYYTSDSERNIARGPVSGPRFDLKEVDNLSTVETDSITLNETDSSRRSTLTPDHFLQKIFVFGGMNPYSDNPICDIEEADVLYFDGWANEWKQHSNMPGRRHHHSAVVYRGKIYIIGGTRPALPHTTKSVFEAAVWSFDPQYVEWQNEAVLPQPRRDFGLVAFDSIAWNKQDSEACGVYVIGGESNHGAPLSSTLFYNVDRKIWSERPPLNIGRYGLAATIIWRNNNAEIWATGGVSGQAANGMPEITNRIEIYYPEIKDSPWKYMEVNLRIPRLFARLCAINKSQSIYIVGGIGMSNEQGGDFLPLSSIDQFDFKENKWVHVTDMSGPRHGHATAIIQDKIFIFGGVSAVEKKTFNSIECFSTTQNAWLPEFESLPQPLSGLAVVVFEGGRHWK